MITTFSSVSQSPRKGPVGSLLSGDSTGERGDRGQHLPWPDRRLCQARLLPNLLPKQRPSFFARLFRYRWLWGLFVVPPPEARSKAGANSHGQGTGPCLDTGWAPRPPAPAPPTPCGPPGPARPGPGPVAVAPAAGRAEEESPFGAGAEGDCGESLLPAGGGRRGRAEGKVSAPRQGPGKGCGALVVCH